MAEFESIDDLLNDFRKRVIRDAKRNLRSGLNRKYPIQASGKLSKSLKSYSKESKNSIQLSFEMEGYGVFQDRGVKGVKSGKSLDGYRYTRRGGAGSFKGMPPPSAFDKWNVRKGIAPRDKTGKFMKRKSINFMMARSVFEKGIKPSLFFTKPFEKYFKTLPDELMEAFGFDMEQLFEQITKENFKRFK